MIIYGINSLDKSLTGDNIEKYKQNIDTPSDLLELLNILDDPELIINYISMIYSNITTNIITKNDINYFRFLGIV